MKMTFRWYGEDDRISLEKIRQIPDIYSVVTALYDVPVGEVWREESIEHLHQYVTSHGMRMEVIESVPVHEDIKLGKPTRDKYIANYEETLRRLARVGVKCVCYNFMPVFDWTRTDLARKNEDGSSSLVYYDDDLVSDPTTSDLSLPGWDTSYKKDELKALFDEYKHIDEDRLIANLGYFLERVIPVAEDVDIKMAIHPDDPPWNIFGLPRIVKNEACIDRILELYDSPMNGLTLCTGSIGAAKDNDVVALTRKYASMGRLHFMHIRNIRLVEGGFEETAHNMGAGSLDIVGVVRALMESGYDGYIRPDHGRMIWDEEGKPGYGLYDRALGASYINGIIDALSVR